MEGAREYFVVGAGGLGCPALLSLASAAVDRITIVDHDRVEASNLQRQVLFDVSMVGMPKAEAAAHRLRRRHPGLHVQACCEQLDPVHCARWVAGLPAGAVVLECTDQPALKFALNDACLAAKVPLVIGAALGWTGQAIAVVPGSACYRCIYEAPPPQELMPTCAQAGVLGPAVGHVGALMAALALSLPERADETAGRLSTIDLRNTSVRTLVPKPRESCPACRAHRAAAPAATPLNC